MFRLLKKFTSRLVRVFGTLLPLVLAAPAMAQWGAVTSQPDTNRFINSQQDFGLIMPHQQVIVGLLDTTITSVGTGGGNASKVIVGSLLDYEDNCVNYTIVNGVASCAGSYEKWREMEKSTSWYQSTAANMFPTNYAITISTGQDSVNIWNRDTAELWMAFGKSGNFLGTGTNADIDFLDGILRIAQSDRALLVADFFTGELFQITNVSNLRYGAIDIQTRNGTSTKNRANSSPVLANTNVNGVAAIRDPFGLKDALGRPEHWWVVSMASATDPTCIYNPHTNAIYDQASPTSTGFGVAMSDRGRFISLTDAGSVDVGFNHNPIFSIAADDYANVTNIQAAVNGPGQFAWTNTSGTLVADYAGIGTSIVGRNDTKLLMGSDQGAYQFHFSGRYDKWSTSGAKQRFSSTVNAPVEFGDNIVAMAFEDNTTDSSPYGNTFTAANSPGTATAVFGNGYSGTVGSYTSHDNDADFNLANLAPMSVTLWVKRGTEANFLDETIWWLSASDGYPYSYMSLVGSGYLMTAVSDGNNESATANFAINDGLWHHLAMVWEGCSGCALRLYVDGVEVASDESITTRSAAFDDLDIGNHAGISNRYFRGMIDDFTLSHTLITPEAIAKLHAEGRKKLAMGTPVFTRTPDDALLSNNVVDIDALDNGIWTVAFSDANTVQVFDGRIPIQQIAAPAGTVKSVALIQSPGTDSVGVAIGTTQNLKFVQPSINLREAMAHQYQEPIHVGSPVVVDSAGVGGIFWTGSDGVKAASNAGRGHVYVMDGEYSGWTITSSYMRIQCSKPKRFFGYKGVVFNGGTASTTNINGDHIEIDHCGFYTAPGGGGGGQSAVTMNTGAYVNFHHNIILGADALGISVNSGNNVVQNNHIWNVDANCIQLSSLAEHTILRGNWSDGCGGGTAVLVDASAAYNVLTSNMADEPFTNNSGTSAFSNNVQW